MTATHDIGLEGVVAFATEIAEPDREGGTLRYRGVAVEELVGRVSFEQVWGLLVDDDLLPGLDATTSLPLEARTSDARADVQAAMVQLAPRLDLKQLLDVDAAQARADLARVSAATLSFAAQAARGGDQAPVSVSDAPSLAARFLTEWRGEADPDHAKAIDAYWITAAEHGMNASTFTERIVASTGADVAAALSAAIGALSGPLHGSAPVRVLEMLDAVEREGDAARYVKRVLDRGE